LFQNLSQSHFTRKEDVKTAGDCILADEDVEYVEGDLVEEVAHYLEDEWSALISGRKGPHIRWEDELFEDVAHSC
jgi:hypothetical protein